jgi:hypothetical protein
MIIHRLSITDSSEYLDDTGLVELVTQIKNYANTHGGSVTVETLKQATVDVSTYNPANKPIINPTSPNDAMSQVEIALSNIPAAVAVEANKAATIDVSTYNPSNKPVIVPTSPNDAMAQVEVTLNNIPSQSGLQLYCWRVDDPDHQASGTYTHIYTNFNIAPTDAADFNDKRCIIVHESLDGPNPGPALMGVLETYNLRNEYSTYGAIANFTRVSDTEFSFNYTTYQGNINTTTFTKEFYGDVTSWLSI